MKVAVIEVKRTGEGDPTRIRGHRRAGDGETRHHVTMVRDTCEHTRRCSRGTARASRPARHGGEIGRMNADAKTLRETWGLNCAACDLDLASPPGSRCAVL